MDGQPILRYLDKAYVEATDDADRRFLLAMSILADEYFDSEYPQREVVAARAMKAVQEIVPELEGIA